MQGFHGMARRRQQRRHRHRRRKRRGGRPNLSTRTPIRWEKLHLRMQHISVTSVATEPTSRPGVRPNSRQSASRSLVVLPSGGYVPRPDYKNAADQRSDAGQADRSFDTTVHRDVRRRNTRLRQCRFRVPWTSRGERIEAHVERHIARMQCRATDAGRMDRSEQHHGERDHDDRHSCQYASQHPVIMHLGAGVAKKSAPNCMITAD